MYPSQPDHPLPLLSHLGELRNRLVYAALAVAACSAVMYPLTTAVIADLARPVGQLVFISPLEAFWSRLQLSLFLGVVLALPVVLFQVWSFVHKGLMPKERRMVVPVTAVSLLLFLGGASFCYFLVLPVGVKFLLAYGSDVMVPMISVSKYLGFVSGMVFSFGLVFELPLVIAFLVKAGLLQAATLRKQRRFAVVVIFIAAAVLTPGPDAFSQLVMAGPLLVLYEIGVIVARIIEKRR